MELLGWPVLIAAVAAHISFLAYLPLGGFLALRWPRSLGLHIAVVVWALGSVIVGYDCPLTDVERWARSRAGLPPLSPAGFIDHYITRHLNEVLPPAGGVGIMQVLVFAAVAVSWIVYARRVRRRPATAVAPISGPG
ncbi:MAG: DUF2784 domain-containing protein [Mycobacterium sp.]|nr:DUF2784 domain-containing protein [Mycobacterium sp.]